MRYFGILFVLMLVLAACDNSGDATLTPAPTLAPTQGASATPEIVNTPVPANTLPPTWTPAPVEPTRTPGRANVATIQVTSTIPFFSGTLTPVAEECNVFAPDSERNASTEQVDPGNDVTIHWTPIEETGYTYRVRLLHPAGMTTIEQEVEIPQFTFTPEMLNSPGFTFGWEVQPLLFGELTCYPISGEIYVNPVFEE